MLHAAQPETRTPILDFLRHHLAGTPYTGPAIHLRYPTAISTTLDMHIDAISPGSATISIAASPERHGNQQGTVHGGLLAELADAAIGTAHSTLMHEGETFTSLDLQIRFCRPVWHNTLQAVAVAVQQGQRISHYRCDIYREDSKLVATATSTVMTLRGEAAEGR